MHPQIRQLATLAILACTFTSLSLGMKAIANVPPMFAQSPSDRQAEARRYREQAIEYLGQGQFEAALESYQKALNIYRDLKDRLREAGTLGGMGVVYEMQGNYEKAIDLYKQGLAINRELGHPEGEVLFLERLGNVYLVLEKYRVALEYAQQNLVLARQLKQRPSEQNALLILGKAYYGLGDYSKAIDSQQQALAIAREIGNRGVEAIALSELGVNYFSLGEYRQAIKHQLEALQIVRELKDRLKEGQTLMNLGNIYSAIGRYGKAIEYQEQSLTIMREVKYPLGEAQSLLNLGITYALLGNRPKAIEYHSQSLAISRQIKSREGEQRALIEIGTVYNYQGKYQQAIKYYQQGLAIARETKDLYVEAIVLANLGIAFKEKGDYRQALDYQNQSLAIARKIKDRKGEAQSLINIANIQEIQGQLPLAIDSAQKGLAIAREINDLKTQGLALSNLGRYQLQTGNLAQAEKTLFTAIQVWESQRADLGSNDGNKINIFQTQAAAYGTLQRVLIAQNKIEAGLEIAERGRSRALVELLLSRLSSTADHKSSKQPSIQQLKQIAKQRNATLVSYSVITDNFKVTGKEPTQESELYIWVIKPTGEITFRKADLKPLWQKENINLADLVLTSRDAIGARGRGLGVSHRPDTPKVTNQLKRLHSLLIEPISDLLPKKSNEKVIFIPQRSLFLVPFPALQDANGKYLIEKHTILASPSIQVLDLTSQQRQKVKNTGLKDVLVVGNPTMPKITLPDAQQLSPLPGAEKEASAIAKLLNTQALIGDRGTETTIKQLLPKARMVHLATHGLFDEFEGLESAIALAPSGKDNGLLTAGEILELKLNAQLVVLSACDTGRGRITGDGVIGLSRSFISAGVPSVIVSLWAVPDAPTASLMTEFYQNLSKNPDKAVALRQAMLNTMKQHPNPRDWAAFTLIGSAE